MKNILRYIAIILLLFIIVFLLVYRKDINEKIFSSTKVEKSVFRDIAINGVIIKTELVTTPEAQTKGLSGRASLGESDGMLFVFSKPDKYYFWMKDMNFPIDIIWFDEDGKIIYIKEKIEPETYPDLFGPDLNSKYVLEVPASFISKNKIKIGDQLAFLPE